MKLFGNRRNGGEHTGHTSDFTDAEIDVSEIRSDETGDGIGNGIGDEIRFEDESAERKKILRRILIIAGSVLAALGIVVGAYFIWEQKPEPISQNQPVRETTPATVAPTKKPGVSAPPEDGPGEDEEPEDNEGALALPVTAGRRDGAFTFLLVGTDRASNSTDTIIVASFDTKEKTVNCVNIPRDTLVNISWPTTPKKVNAVYPGYFNTYKGNPGRYGDYDSAEAYGVYGLREHIRKLLGFYVDYYVLVDIQAVEDLVDAIGGVEFDVPEDMYYYDYVQDLLIDIKAGRQILNGENAVKLCRFRSTYAAADLKRIEVQQSFLKAMARQLISAKSIPHLTEILEIVEREVNTDLEVANVAWLARQFLGCSMDDVTFQTAPLSPRSTGINDISFVGVEADAWLEMVNSALSPFTEDVTLQNMDLLTFSANGGVYANTGVIAGGIDSFYCTRCTVATGKAVAHAPGAHLVIETEEPEPADTPPEETGGESGTEGESTEGSGGGAGTEQAPPPQEGGETPSAGDPPAQE